MAKSKIIKELANNKISLEVALNRLLIIASDINNAALQSWAEKELNGYNGECVPKYRIVKNAPIKYSGISGNFKITNAPLLLQELFDEDKSELFHVNVTDSIGTIERYINGKERNKMCRDLTLFANFVYQKTGIQCSSITQVIPDNSFENILSTMKTTLMKVFIQLDKTYGCLDDLDIDITAVETSVVEKSNKIINNYIFIDNSVCIGDDNKIVDSNIK